jgi:predicted transcriptional regulator
LTGKAFRVWRLTRDIPAWEVSKALNIHPSLLSKIERQRIELSDEVEFRMRKFMNEYEKK